MAADSTPPENYILLKNYKTKENIVVIKQPGRFTVGRRNSTKTSDIKLPSRDNYFSGQHFILDISRGWQVRLKDNRSTNGTELLVDKEKNQFIRLNYGEEVFLRDGDVFQAGRTQFQIEIHGPRKMEGKEVAVKVEHKKAMLVQLN